jgi:tetratricopeptide (TPR) repeat protein
VILDGAAADTLAAGFATVSTDLSTRPSLDPPFPTSPSPAPGMRWPVAPPPPEDRRAIAESGRALGEAGYQAERTRWAIAREREDLSALQGYLGNGLERARREAAELEAHATLLDSLNRTLDAIDARLRSVRDEATRRILTRSAKLLRGCADDLLWLGAMRLYHIEGPNRGREDVPPAGMHTPETVVIQEEMLVRSIHDMVEIMVKDAPSIIARSYERRWRPGMIERAAAQDSAAHRALAWARGLSTSIDSSIAAAGSSDSLRWLEARLATLTRRADSLGTAHQALRAAVARRAVEHALAALEGEREGIDYGLAASAYGRSVGLGALRAAADDSLDDPESVRWQGEGIALLRSFLERHPDSFARGDMRFRLADLLLVQARREFREAMARYVEDQARGGSGHVALPVLSHGEALTLYRKILAEDSTFEHRDAVLFNSGMILADEGSSEAGRFFADLVAHHPDSPYSQEAWLRMGDMQFNEKRYVESVPLYQHAAGGADASLTAIALYKMGWAHYNGDRFAEAADAFRGVLDLYASDRRRQIQVDIEGEAEAYLVHSLAGAGGAKAFAAYFDRIGRRPYEVRVLMAMGQQYRRLGRFGEATAADEMVIRRYPQSPEALLGAQRLIETRQRSEKPAEVREARLAYAPTFAPGSPWYTAQTSDSVRAAGAAFARSSWESVAREHHRKARETGSREDWRAALDLYEKVLTQWPGGPEEPAIELQAGEAAAQIGRYDVALRHYGAAALSGPDSVTTQALWQRVAVTDAWYESTRDGATAPGQSKSGRSGIGRDSLARAEMVAADELLARYPDHPHGAEIAWRQGNLAFAHGWYEDAAGRFARMAARYPADPRAPRAAILTADAWFKLGRFDQAGGAYESALTTARRAGVDSLARRASQAIPIAWYRNAEAAVAADSSAHAHHAELFEQVASRWPDFEHAPLAQYRAGLAWLEAGKNAEAVRAMETLVAHFPKSEFVRDAHLQIARAWESAGEREKSASAYARFAERFPADTSAANATLHAADLYSATGMTQRADELRLGYVQKHPGDFETAMDVLEPLARRDLATVGPQHPISALLGAESPAKAPRGRRALAAKPATTAAHSYLSDYLKIAAAHPDLASKGLLAQVRFERGEEAYFASDSLPLRQPLPASIAARQKRVDQTLALYRQCVDVGVAEWSHAATFRIGRTLVAFGEALERSDRPADLQGDALRAYEDVLRERSLAISDRGEAVWADLLRGQAEKPADIWIARARDSLWPRLGSRFFFRPEMEFPAMAAEPARRIHVEKEPGDRPAKHARRNAPETPTVSQREGSDR